MPTGQDKDKQAIQDALRKIGRKPAFITITYLDVSQANPLQHWWIVTGGFTWEDVLKTLAHVRKKVLEFIKKNVRPDQKGD